jgi:hypothetical protein
MLGRRTGSGKMHANRVHMWSTDSTFAAGKTEVAFKEVVVCLTEGRLHTRAQICF